MRFITLLMALLAGAAFADPDVPNEPPETSTLSAVCVHGKPMVMVVVVTYPSGKLVRYDAEHMHGFLSAQQLADYAQTAKDHQSYVACGEES